MVNAVKIFKKSTFNGKLTVYLGRRDFIDNTECTEPIDGVVLLANDYIKDRKVFANVIVTYRFGHEDDEMMGLSFSKEIKVSSHQIYPAENTTSNGIQERLVKKLGPNAFPFNITIPENAPSSVLLHSSRAGKALGVMYDLRIFVADDINDKPHKRNSVNLTVRKIQFLSEYPVMRQPTTLVSKGFILSSGKLNLEVTLDKDVFHHGEQVVPNIRINNGSKKTVKNITCSIIQNIGMTMTNNNFSREVASLNSMEGLPITPGSSFCKSLSLTTLTCATKSKDGIALGSKFKESDVILASSSLMAPGKDLSDVTGIAVSYYIRVRVNCGAIGGELLADVPFKLVHPNPGYNSAPGDLEFEEFSRKSRSMAMSCDSAA